MMVAVVGALLYRSVQGEGALSLQGAVLRGGGLYLLFHCGGGPATVVHDPQIVVVHADPKQAILAPIGAPAVAPNPVPKIAFSLTQASTGMINGHM